MINYSQTDIPALPEKTYNIYYNIYIYHFEHIPLLRFTGSAITEAFEDFDQGPPGVGNGSWRDVPLPPTPEPLGENW